MPAMPEVFFQLQGQPPRGLASIRRDTNGQPQTIPTALPDGDTVGVHLSGSGGIRFLGIDTPEKTFELPANGRRSLDSPQWEAYLTDPFQPQFGTFDVGPDLKAHLQTRIGAGAGVNHRVHGNAAEQALIDLVQADMIALGQTTQNFQFFIAFSFEVFDPFGRFLAFVNRQQPDANLPSPRPLSYNERMLEKGASLPYFIWPNIDPFRAKPLLSAVIAPGTAKTVAIPPRRWPARARSSKPPAPPALAFSTRPTRSASTPSRSATSAATSRPTAPSSTSAKTTT